jgi:hypothetical protein
MNEELQNEKGGATLHVDRGLLTICELAVKRGLEPACGNVPIWNGGLGEIVEQALYDAGVPKGGVPVIEIARQLGILKRSGDR